MPPGKSFDRRRKKLNEYLRNRTNPLTLDEITEKLIEDLNLKSLHKRTVQEDIKHFMDEYNAPIVSKRKGTRVEWQYDDSNFSIDKMPIDPEELLSLQEAIDILYALKTFPVAKSLQELVIKLKQRGGIDEDASKDFIHFETNENTAGYKYLGPLYDAVKAGTVLQITYQQFVSESKRNFIIHPYLLKEYRNRWYVVCMIDGKNDITTFALDRISKIKASSKDYKQNKDFDPGKYFANLIGISRKKEDRPVIIKIKVAKTQVPYFKSQPLHDTQEIVDTYEDGSVLMQYNLIINYELKQLLMSYADSIKIIEPVELRGEIGKMVKGFF